MREPLLGFITGFCREISHLLCWGAVLLDDKAVVTFMGTKTRKSIKNPTHDPPPPFFLSVAMGTLHTGYTGVCK